MRKDEIQGPKKQPPGKCMAGNPILENNTHFPERVLRYPGDNIVIAIPEPFRCCGKAAVCEQSGCARCIMEHLSLEIRGI